MTENYFRGLHVIFAEKKSAMTGAIHQSVS